MANIGRSLKNTEAPRPLKTQSRSSLKNNYMLIEELIQLIENVAITLQSGVSSMEPMASLVQNLRVHGPQLESVSKDTLDRAFVVFRNASQDERLNIMTRLNLLELIELRAKGWTDTGLNSYYKTKQATSAELPDIQHQLEPGFLSTSPTFVPGVGGTVNATTAAIVASVGSAQQQQLLLGPGEVLRNSGKFLKPTKIPGKKYCKDEVVIRNADSGKVMGIKGRRVHMIEELSETIISFQKVNPGAKERLMQITGPTEDKINYAKQLIDDTIRRNASPVRLDPSVSGAGSCSSLASSNSDEAAPRNSVGNSNLANRLSFNSAQNFMTGQQAAAQQQVGNVIATTPTSTSTTAIVPSTGKLMRTNQQMLLHSYSTNDASLGEYKYTVNVGQHIIKITGDCCEFVQVAKLVLDDYFSSAEFLASVEAGAALDGSLVSPISTPTTPIGAPQFTMSGNHRAPTPLLDSANKFNITSGQMNIFVHDGDEVFTPLNELNTSSSQNLSRSRRSHFSRKDSTSDQTCNNNTTSSRKKSESGISGDNIIKDLTRIIHEYEHLLYYAKSPHAWAFPSEWQKICDKFPTIIRNKDLQDESGRFNGEKYLEVIKSISKRNIVAAEETINDFDNQDNE